MCPRYPTAHPLWLCGTELKKSKKHGPHVPFLVWPSVGLLKSEPGAIVNELTVYYEAVSSSEHYSSTFLSIKV